MEENSELKPGKDVVEGYRESDVEGPSSVSERKEDKGELPPEAQGIRDFLNALITEKDGVEMAERILKWTEDYTETRKTGNVKPAQSTTMYPVSDMISGICGEAGMGDKILMEIEKPLLDKDKTK